MPSSESQSWVEQIAGKIWTREKWIPWKLTQLHARMTLVRLEPGLLLHSPLPLNNSDLNFIESRGEVRWIVSPNRWHYRYLKSARDLFEEAKFYLPPAPARRYPELDPAGTLDADPNIAGQKLKIIPVGGSPLVEEYVFILSHLRTVIVGDLIEYFYSRGPLLMRLIARPHGVYNHYDIARVWRWTVFDREVMRRAINDILSYQPRRLILAHGPVAEDSAAEIIKKVFDWLLSS